MKDVHILVCCYVESVYDEEEGDDPWKYEGTQVHEGHVSAIHTTRLPFKDLLSYDFQYAHTPYQKPRRFDFQLEDESEYGYVVFMKTNEYWTFGGKEGVIEVVEVFDHEEDAKDFTAKLTKHFSELSPFEFSWGASVYTLHYQQAYDVEYGKFKVQ